MKLHPRHKPVSRAGLQIREGFLELFRGEEYFEDMLIPVARMKVSLLIESRHNLPETDMSSLRGDLQAVNEIVRKAMKDHDLTKAEAYHILTEWELSQARYMLQTERREGDTEE